MGKKKQHWNAGKLTFFLIEKKKNNTIFKIKAFKTVAFFTDSVYCLQS